MNNIEKAMECFFDLHHYVNNYKSRGKKFKEEKQKLISFQESSIDWNQDQRLKYSIDSFLEELNEQT